MRHIQGLPVLSFQTVMVDVAALRGRRPNPALFRLSGGNPACFENLADSGSHGQDAFRGFRLAMRDAYSAMTTIDPRNLFPAHPVAFLGPHASVEKENGYSVQERLRNIQIQRFLLRAQHSVAAMLTGQKLDSG